MQAADLAAAGEIWNRIVRDTTVTFTTEEKTGAALAAWLDGPGPRLAAAEGGRLLGFASYGAFRGGPGYARIAEHTVYIAEEARGAGAGRALMAALEGEARAAGLGSLIGGVSGENDSALRFHARLGYAEVGRVPRAGWKFGRWLDLVLVQKLL